eukprot:4532222-Pyramimonas_sp.AAC.1
MLAHVQDGARELRAAQAEQAGQVAAQSSDTGCCEAVDGSSGLLIRDCYGGAHLMGALLGLVRQRLGCSEACS